MKKIIVYGNGKIFNEVKHRLAGCKVIAVADRSVVEKQSIVVNGYKVDLISPYAIEDYQYDYIAISVMSQFEHIKQQLIGENKINKEKLLSVFMFVEGRDYANDMNVQYVKSLYEGDKNTRIHVAYTLPSDNELTKMSKAGTVYRYVDKGQTIYAVRENPADTSVIHSNIDIYVVTHKEYVVLEEDIYKPITVGHFRQQAWLSDDVGDNISQLNKKINECTAMYWIWKNSTADIVGINHYRRYFYNNEFKCRENVLNRNTVLEALKDFDIIVYKARVPDNQTIEYEIKNSLNANVYDMGLCLIKKHLAAVHPDYLEDLREVWQAKACCYCNMLVAKKAVYDSYCEWLFSFLIPAAVEADVEGLDSYNERVMGFFAERMLTVWLHHQNLKVKELPVYIP